MRSLGQTRFVILFMALTTYLATSAGALASEGSIDPDTGLITPKNITGQLPYAGSVSASESSYYVVHNLVPGANHTLYVHSLTQDISIGGYGSSFFLGALCSSNRSGLSQEACSLKANSNGEIYIKVSASYAAIDATFIVELLNPAVNQGSATAPLVIAAPDLPVRGTVDDEGRSYYEITGLIPGQIYEVSLIDMIFGAELQAFPSKYFVDGQINARCYSNNPSWESERCRLAANFEGKIYISVSALSSWYVKGAYYTLNAANTGETERYFEGYLGDPVSLDGRLPYAGQTFLYPSQYRISGLVPGSRHEVHIKNYSGSTTLQVQTLSADPGGTYCQRFSYYDVTGNDMWCVAAASNAGNLNIDVSGQAAEGGSSYIVDIAPAPVAEGAELAPKAVSMPYDGQVDTTSSYYVVPGLMPHWTYTVITERTTRNILVTAGPGFSSSLFYNTGRTNAAGELYIRVNGGGTSGDGARFILGLAEANNPEGAADSPVDVSGATESNPHAGQVDDRESFYAITGLTPGQYYMTHVNGVSNRPTLTVYTDHAYTAEGCREDYIDATREGHCLAPANAAGELYIKISNAVKITGSTYNLWVAPSLIVSEGYSDAPLDIDPNGKLNLSNPVAVTHNGSVSAYMGDNVSYYKVFLTHGPDNYTVSLTGLTDDVDLEVYDGVSSYTQWCTSKHRNLDDESCVITSQEVRRRVKYAELLIKVTAQPTSSGHYLQWDGARFLLTVAPDGTPATAEGSQSAPVDVTGRLPYNGQVLSYGDKSYYKLAGLEPYARYEVQIKNKLELMNLAVYTDAGYTYDSQTCEVWFSTPPPPHDIACESPANAAGELYIVADGRQIQSSATSFLLDLKVAPTAEGVLGAPVDVTGLLPRPSQVGGLFGASSQYTQGEVNSYYAVYGLTPGAAYQVRLANPTRPVKLAVYGDSAHSLANCEEGGYLLCESVANGEGALHIHIDGYYTPNQSGAYFDLHVTPVPVAEGSAGAPKVLAFPVDHDGHGGASGAGDSYYKVTGLVPYSSHRVLLRDNTAEKRVEVYGQASFKYKLCDTIESLSPLGCAAAANSDGELYIRIKGYGFYSAANAGEYNILIQ